MIHVVLPVFFHTDNSATMKDCGIDYNLSDCDIRQMDFFEIGSIVDYIEDTTQLKYTSIFSNGNEFICTMPKEKVLQMILNRQLHVPTR